MERKAGWEYIRAQHPDRLHADTNAIADRPKRHMIQKAGPVEGSVFFGALFTRKAATPRPVDNCLEKRVILV